MPPDAETEYSAEIVQGALYYVKNIWQYCRLFCKFCLASLSAAVLDIGLFSLFFYVCFQNMEEVNIFGTMINSRLLFAQVFARAVSSIWNFAVNRYLVFKCDSECRNSLWLELTKYYILVVAVLAAASATMYIADIFLPENLIAAAKIAVDIFLFIVVYGIQKIFVFNSKENADPADSNTGKNFRQ